MHSACVTINHKTLFYYEVGSGFPIVLLHGYLESNEVWSDFAVELSKKYRVICPDLPGHGKSEALEKQSIELMSDTLNKLLVLLKIKKTIIIGHSMGGYVTLAFAEQFSDMLRGFCLFHSHPFADSDEKKMNRLQEIELIKKGKKNLIINSAIPKMFADKFFEQRKNLFEKSLSIAIKTSKEGMIACINSMIKRFDKSEFLLNTKLPVLWISGKYDDFFSYKEMAKFTNNNKQIKSELLELSGHMGMVEEPKKSLQLIYNFIQRSI